MAEQIELVGEILSVSETQESDLVLWDTEWVQNLELLIRLNLMTGSMEILGPFVV